VSLTPSGLSAEQIKACCAAGYQSDLVALVLGDSYHPGGAALTRRLAELASLAGKRVLDVASGPGTSAMLLARELGAEVIGVDLGEEAVAAANARAAEAGLAGEGRGKVRFVAGDAERLPLGDGSVDAVVSECALCTFPDKLAAVLEMARVLVPGGTVAIADVVVDSARLDPDLADLAGWVACLADARSEGGYLAIFEAAGLETRLVERHDQALAAMVDQIAARLAALKMAGSPALSGVDLSQVDRRVEAARRAVADGVAGYALFVARRPTS